MKQLKDLQVGDKIRFGRYKRNVESPEDITWWVIGKNVVEAYNDTSEFPSADKRYRGDTVTLQSEHIHDVLQSTPYNYSKYIDASDNAYKLYPFLSCYPMYYQSTFRVWLNSNKTRWVDDIKKYQYINSWGIDPDIYVEKKVGNTEQYSAKYDVNKAYTNTEYRNHVGFLNAFSTREQKCLLKTKINVTGRIGTYQGNPEITKSIQTVYDYMFLPSCLDGADVSEMDKSFLSENISDDRTFNDNRTKLYAIQLKYTEGCIDKLKSDGVYDTSFTNYDTYSDYLRSDSYTLIQSRSTPFKLPPAFADLKATELWTSSQTQNIRFTVMNKPVTQYRQPPYCMHLYTLPLNLNTNGLRNTETVCPLTTLKGNVFVSDTPDEQGYYNVIFPETTGELTDIYTSTPVIGKLGATYIDWNEVENASYDLKVNYDYEQFPRSIYSGSDTTYAHLIPNDVEDVEYVLTAYDSTGEVINTIRTAWLSVQTSLPPQVTITIDDDVFTTDRNNEFTVSKPIHNNSKITVTGLSNSALGEFSVSVPLKIYDRNNQIKTQMDSQHTIVDNGIYEWTDRYIQDIYLKGEFSFEVSSENHSYTVKVNVTKDPYTAEIENVDILECDDMPQRLRLQIDGTIVPEAIIKIIACNNAYDTHPVWEDITNIAMRGRIYNFENKTKSADKWGIKYRIEIYNSPTNANRCVIRGVTGSYD